jgi:altronate dehydratase large subunit
VVIHPDDDVAIATRRLVAGEKVAAGGKRVDVLETIPFGHKLAIHPVLAGHPVRKYGRCIGRALEDIQVGTHVHVQNCGSERDTPTSTLCPAIAAAPGFGTEHGGGSDRDWPSEARLTGYPRSRGRPGIRNHVLVLPTVQCANGVVERVSREIHGVVTIPHIYGCSQVAPDLAQTVRVLEGFATHPNVAATLLVALGCEEVPYQQLADRVAASGRLSALLVIQEEGGSRRTFQQATGILREFSTEAAAAQRVALSPSDLLIGLECGGSDAWSGVTANPAVGVASDTVVAAGGTVILSEATEFIGAEQRLAVQAASREIGQRILDLVRCRERALRDRGLDLRGAQPAPGNVAGGITTPEEKSLGAIAKGGHTPVREVLAYAQAPSRPGLVIMDTAGNDAESVTGMVAAGAQAVLFTTGRGSPAGCAIAPTMKIATNTPMHEAMHEDMDLNAGSILDGESIEAAGERIVSLLAAVACGKLTAAEHWGHREFAIEAVAQRV